MLRMPFAGDDADHVGDLVADAMYVLRWAAEPALVDRVDRVVRQHRLRNAMMRAWVAAGRTIDEPNRLAAAAALMLIEHAEDVFGRDYRERLPPPNRLLRGVGYVPGAAYRLAERVAGRLIPAWPDNYAASHRLSQVIAERADALARGDLEEWAKALPVLAETLLLYDLPVEKVREMFPIDDDESGQAAEPEPEPTEADREAEVWRGDVSASTPDSAIVETGEKDEAVPPAAPAPGVERPVAEVDDGDAVDGRRSRRKASTETAFRRRVGPALLVAAITLVVVVGTAEAVPAVPRVLFGWQVPTPEPLVDSYVIPPLPERTSEVASPIVLPNTIVQLFLMSDGSSPVRKDQTVNGWLPEVSAPVVPAVYDSVTFQVWLTVRPGAPAPDKDLWLSIQLTTPMRVQDARLMSDAVHEGPERSELNSHDDGSGGTAIAVEPLSAGTAVIYQFRVMAEPLLPDNSYLCGYNAKSVQILVRKGPKDGDSRQSVVTPYPLYVPRGRDC
jgi:hypothetical protein